MKQIPWYEWLYSITEDWKVFSDRNNIYVWKNPSWEMVQSFDKWYMCIRLQNKWRKLYTWVHRLVALTFIPNPENKDYVNHINWIKTDNRIENLERVTAKENERHSRDILWKVNSQKQRDSASIIWKLQWKKVKQYDLNGNYINTFESHSDASRKLWITNSNISACVRGVRPHAWWFFRI